MPGAYKIVWDGNDDKKAPVVQGDYFVCIEAAREHGPYEIVREQDYELRSNVLAICCAAAVPAQQ